jgi:hypothetical protein
MMAKTWSASISARPPEGADMKNMADALLDRVIEDRRADGWNAAVIDDVLSVGFGFDLDADVHTAFSYALSIFLDATRHAAGWQAEAGTAQMSVWEPAITATSLQLLDGSFGVPEDDRIPA